LHEVDQAPDAGFERINALPVFKTCLLMQIQSKNSWRIAGL